mmetsp:Transcript_8313/g.14223  ORF Transcript_8313/g.14223 Transcript_8313/m.14223 type:complete len:221 (-) Transcript_8313:32-694(-)
MKTVSRQSSDTTEDYNYVRIGPMGRHLLRWHFSVAGPADSEFEGGVYHGIVRLPKNYPTDPPMVQVFTPSGRFIPGHDICLSATAFHPESWTPRWSILSLIDALRLHMLTQANEIGGLDSKPDERRRLAKLSRKWSMGRVEHDLMIKEGIFPFEEKEQPQVSSSQSKLDGEALRAVLVPDQTGRQKCMADQVVESVFKVLTSPVRLAMVGFLVFFAILNW